MLTSYKIFLADHLSVNNNNISNLIIVFLLPIYAILLLKASELLSKRFNIKFYKLYGSVILSSMLLYIIVEFLK